jgi:hypothetical protein
MQAALESTERTFPCDGVGEPLTQPGVAQRSDELLRKDKDPVTWNLALTILQQEVEHEEDLQSLREDVDLLLGRAP